MTTTLNRMVSVGTDKVTFEQKLKGRVSMKIPWERAFQAEETFRGEVLKVDMCTVYLRKTRYTV